MIEFHPALAYFAAGLLAFYLPSRVRRVVQLALPLAAWFLLRQAVQAGEAAGFFSPLPGVRLHVLRLDSLALFFAYAFLLFSFLANLYALHVEDKWVHAAANFYTGSSLAAVLAGDFAVLFVCWELMAAASAVLIWNRRRKGSSGALVRYALVHLAGGLFLFSGILLRWTSHGTLSFEALGQDAASWLILAGFVLNAALVPLHAWLPDAYPEGTPAGSVYLSAFTTKVAVYALARGFMGADCLVWLGIISAVYGVVFALMENDMRRLLSYHIVCQIGYMVLGIGLGSEIGVSAAAAHAAGNIFFKGLLFMAAGAIIHRSGKYRLDELGGLARGNRALVFFYMLGALAISGFPLLNGYVSKSLLVKALEKSHAYGFEFVLLVTAAGTFMSIGLKLAYFAFWGEKKDKPIYEAACPGNMIAAMMGTALLCVFLGVFPQVYDQFLPYFSGADHVYSFDHVVHTLQLLAGTGLVFVLILRFLHAEALRPLDVDWFYRRGAALFLKGLCQPVFWTQTLFQNTLSVWIEKLDRGLKRALPRQAISSVARPVISLTAAGLVAGLMMLKFWKT